LQHVDLRGLSVSAQASLPVHPTELYESLAGALLLVITWQLRKASRFRGEVFLAFTFGYGYLRFLLEIVRDDSERGSFGPAFREHVLIPSLLVLLAAAFAYGPLRSVARVAVRRAVTALAFALPVLAYFLLRPPPAGAPNVVQLSTSQWISLVTAIAASLAWQKRAELAQRELAQARPLSST
jgi:phosphatidylglycerol:prolipoprotein diacylglycerol transferase